MLQTFYNSQNPDKGVFALPVSDARESGEIWPQKHGSQTWELEGEGL